MSHCTKVVLSDPSTFFGVANAGCMQLLAVDLKRLEGAMLFEQIAKFAS